MTSAFIFDETASAGCKRTAAQIGASAVWDTHQHTFSLATTLYMVNLNNVFFLHCLLKRCCVCRLSPMEYHVREEILKLRAAALKKVKDCSIVLH